MHVVVIGCGFHGRGIAYELAAENKIFCAEIMFLSRLACHRSRHLSPTVNAISNDAQYFKHQIGNCDASDASWVMQW